MSPVVVGFLHDFYKVGNLVGFKTYSCVKLFISLSVYTFTQYHHALHYTSANFMYAF